MKFISLLAIAACAVLVSAAPHGGSNQEVNNHEESNVEVYDNRKTKAQINSQKKVDGNTANNNSGILSGVLGGNPLKNTLQGGLNVFSKTTVVNSDTQAASNKND